MALAHSNLADDGSEVASGRKGSLPPVGLLAEAWEDDRVIRDRIRHNDGKLVQWVSPQLINKPSMAAIAMNSCALTHLARWWCRRQGTPKSPSVLDLKKEVNHLRGMCQLPTDLVALHSDAWGLKKLFTYGVRKSGSDKLASGSPLRREVGTNPFFDELFVHWNVRLQQGVKTIVVEVEGSDDESTDFSEFIVVKDDPYLVDNKAVKATTGQPSTTTTGMVKFEGNEKHTEVVFVEDPTPTKVKAEQPSGAKTTVDESQPRVISTGLPTDDESVGARIAKLKSPGQSTHLLPWQYWLELAKRAASSCVPDTAETQPLGEGLATAVASALAAVPEPKVATFEENKGLMDNNDDGLKRSLQRQFSSMITEDPYGECPNADDEPMEEVPDNQLGLRSECSSPMCESNEAHTAPALECKGPGGHDEPSEQPAAAGPSDMHEAGGDSASDVLQTVPVREPANDAKPPEPEEGQPMHAKPEEEHPMQAEPEPAEAEPSDPVGKVNVESPEAFAETHVSAAAPAAALKDDVEVIPEDEDEPPVVTRRDQWGLKPPSKPRGRKPATPKPKDEPKPKAKAKAGSKGVNLKWITIDDVLEPTPAPPSATASSSQSAAAASSHVDGEGEGSRLENGSKLNKRKKEPAKKAESKRKARAPKQNAEAEDAVNAEDQPASELGEVDASPEQPSKDGPAQKKSKKDQDGQDAKTFARRFCPKTSPARERWLAVREIFNKQLKSYVTDIGFSSHAMEVEWWDWCSDALQTHEEIQQLSRRSSSEECLTVLTRAVTVEMKRFLDETMLMVQ